uniref:Uncharacterized protein n=1 Tax=viral metagenome TaxID=1070528 RepID=A0A6C0CX42_9ZZZZ
MNSNIPEYVNNFIDFNKQTLSDIYEAGTKAETEGLLMIEIVIDKNESQVYYVGKKRFEEMGKGDFYEEIKTKVPEDKKDNMILYIMDKSNDKVYLLVVNMAPGSDNVGLTSETIKE